jgi:SAM-dependent methyltransferase
LSNRLRDPIRYLAAHGWRRYSVELRRELVTRAIKRLARLLPNDSDGDPFHRAFCEFLAEVNGRPRPRVLEIGARGKAHRHLIENPGEYVGVDIHPGDGVDVVGDAHRLSTLVPRDHFDAIFSISVFEHLAMPWKAVLETNRVLKPGGLVFAATHPTWPPHELPWDFWRFGPESFRTLFNRGTGFELLDVVQGIPCSIVPHGNADQGVAESQDHLAVAVTARKVGEPMPGLHWEVPIDTIVGSSYPLHDQGIAGRAQRKPTPS